jgi:hypothetical protein
LRTRIKFNNTSNIYRDGGWVNRINGGLNYNKNKDVETFLLGVAATCPKESEESPPPPKKEGTLLCD